MNSTPKEIPSVAMQDALLRRDITMKQSQMLRQRLTLAWQEHQMAKDDAAYYRRHLHCDRAELYRLEGLKSYIRGWNGEMKIELLTERIKVNTASLAVAEERLDEAYLEIESIESKLASVYQNFKNIHLQIRKMSG